MVLSPTTKQRIAIVLNVSKFVFQWGFIPAVLFLGFSKGADPGMPELTLMNLLWQ
ncbi:PREDICTED: mitochondrial import receptor subunit TOM7 homolog [Acromyrmex echinatior]|uniref:Mitochondrial import receptor subunit TOM7 homolog n=2 Tax=Attini TaxID=143999 RepID=A0A158NNL3_ATTCE|nr:PREDICTED: mitochondrial import receptor subunit TOM7 homolog [Acromyrmex echinatior]XP_011704013.1 PREDICTED: mitochondrial import receptor subunit TOM7 homolog [Wasmannia auropunctata]XP_012059121.1 PREDICTED: mitochondrial import receptor subunit TOM7 homolog [Atta cephalotes]XP_018054960.1 PREDICTED: mitochondrial import receptor subunit TOM7 homolog [Atta colombica]